MYKPLFFFVLSGWHLFVSGLPRPGSSTNETVLGDGEGLASNGSGLLTGKGPDWPLVPEGLTIWKSNQPLLLYKHQYIFELVHAIYQTSKLNPTAVADRQLKWQSREGLDAVIYFHNRQDKSSYGDVGGALFLILQWTPACKPVSELKFTVKRFIDVVGEGSIQWRVNRRPQRSTAIQPFQDATDDSCSSGNSFKSAAVASSNDTNSLESMLNSKTNVTTATLQQQQQQRNATLTTIDGGNSSTLSAELSVPIRLIYKTISTYPAISSYPYHELLGKACLAMMYLKQDVPMGDQSFLPSFTRKVKVSFNAYNLHPDVIAGLYPTEAREALYALAKRGFLNRIYESGVMHVERLEGSVYVPVGRVTIESIADVAPLASPSDRVQEVSR